MTAPSYAVDLAARLIRCESVTPAEGGALSLLAKELGSLGFECTWLPFGEGSARIENLFARRGHGAPHFAFAGHTDVVPGSLPGKPLADGSPGPSLYCAVIIKKVDEKTRAKTSVNDLLRD